MAKQVIGVGTVANDGTGDALRAAMGKVNDNFTEVYGFSFTKTYWFLAESTLAAISHTGGATNTYLTNNALGSETTEYNPDSKGNVWDTSTNKFDLTSLKVGDVVNITGRLLFDNAAAQEVNVFMSVAEGTASAHEHQVNHTYYKTAATGTGLTFAYPFLVKSAAERDGGARFRFASATGASLSSVEWSAVITEV